MKNYEFLLKVDYDKRSQDSNKKIWRHYSNKKKKSLPHAPVFGVANLKQDNQESDCYLTQDEYKLSVEQVEKKNAFVYKTCGYVQCKSEVEEVGYIRIIKSRLIKSLLLLLLMIGLLAGGICLYMNMDKGPVLDEAAIAYRTPDGVGKNTEKDRISIPGYGPLIIKKDTSNLYAALVNPEGNPCYFKYQIVLSDTEEILYESDLIKPGMAITDIKLDRKLPQGTYEVQLRITTASLEDHTVELNGGEVITTIIAK